MLYKVFLSQIDRYLRSPYLFICVNDFFTFVPSPSMLTISLDVVKPAFCPVQFRKRNVMGTHFNVLSL